MTPDEGANAAAAETATAIHTAGRNRVRTHIAGIARRIADESFGSGALAELRRNHPMAVAATPSFHRLTASMDDVSWTGDAPLRWATLIQAIAMLSGPNLAKVSLPKARAKRSLRPDTPKAASLASSRPAVRRSVTKSFC